jgi:creatinine amidohydrolase|tara:strand:- start:308 stop:1045 length:738 start_codon:yes stop_codon:yes gene_type:complete
MKEKVKYSELLPHEFRKRISDRAIAYLPLGTLEWHGEHMALGSDAIQSEGLMEVSARRFGGVVMPPIHLGPDRITTVKNGEVLIGMDSADSTTPPRQLDGSCYWLPKNVFSLMIDSILVQLKRAGFKAVFADGHGPSRSSWTEELKDRELRFGLKLLGVTEEIQNKGWMCQVDHAGRNETSIMMNFRDDLVDLSRLSEDRSELPQGVGGIDPRDATSEYGKECIEKSLGLLKQMLDKTNISQVKD